MIGKYIIFHPRLYDNDMFNKIYKRDELVCKPLFSDDYYKIEKSTYLNYLYNLNISINIYENYINNLDKIFNFNNNDVTIISNPKFNDEIFNTYELKLNTLIKETILISLEDKIKQITTDNDVVVPNVKIEIPDKIIIRKNDYDKNTKKDIVTLLPHVNINYETTPTSNGILVITCILFNIKFEVVEIIDDSNYGWKLFSFLN